MFIKRKRTENNLIEIKSFLAEGCFPLNKKKVIRINT